jgi:polysaccharide pyruvyl transferase WcaK-like protein
MRVCTELGTSNVACDLDTSKTNVEEGLKHILDGFCKIDLSAAGGGFHYRQTNSLPICVS